MNKNRKSIKQTQQFVKTYKSILHTFGEIQEASSLNKSHVMDLVKIHKQNAFFFDKAFEQTFLKIFRSFHEKANKKIPAKFETVADLLFKELMKNQSSEAATSLNEFCDLLSEAIYSTIMNVRVMASRILFLVLKGVPNTKLLNKILTEKTQSLIGKAVLFLVKQKVSTYRQLGIKLSSIVLSTQNQSNSSIENQLFKILSTEDNQMIRKMVITNIPLTTQNIDQILIRLRDKNSQIRATLLRRLGTDNFRLQNLKLNNIYKLLYDGYGTKDIICKQEALRYFASFFRENEMQQENKFENFVELFQPNLLLVNSHLYVLFNRLLGDLMGLLPTQRMCEYIMKLCSKVKSLLKDKSVSLSNELIWLKNASSFKPQIKQINSTFQEYSPSGTEFAELLRLFLQKRNIFAINEFLQMFSNIKMPDQIGRNRMFDILRDTLKKMGKFEIDFNLNQIRQDDDICNVQKQEQIKLKKFMLSYYDIPIISNSMDLIFPIISAMKNLRPQSFVNELQQTISDFENPDQYPIYKEKSTLELTLKSLVGQSAEKEKNKQKIEIINEKLQKINHQIGILKEKTVASVTALSKIQHNWNFDAYMPLIKEELGKKDSSYGIYLLGLYCLQSVQKVKLFFPVFWHNIMEYAPQDASQQQKYQYKLNLMISLKIVTDFIVKFNILNSQTVMNNTSTDESTDYNSDTFMEKVTHLILHKDSDIRIFSIECLCRMIYHNRVDDNNISTYFLYLLLLWWETNALQVSAKSVHTISLFFRSYIEKGNEQVKKLAEMLCIFHKILLIFLEKNKTINKELIVYNLKMNEFIKKTVSIATTVLKYHKQKKTIWNYQQPEVGPQQFFLLYLLYEPGFQNMLERPVNISDFYVKCPLETLHFVKNRVQRFASQVENGQFFPNSYRHDKTVTKKSLQELGRFEKEIQSHIQVKNQESFNQQIVNSLDKIFQEMCKYVNEEAKRIAKNIEDAEIFIDIDSDVEDDSDIEIQRLSSLDNNSQKSLEEASQLSEARSQTISQQSSVKSQSKHSQSVRVIKIQQRKVDPIKKKPIIQQIEVSSQSEKEEKNDSEDEIQQIQIKPANKGRKRLPREQNLLASKFLTHISEQQVNLVASETKTVQPQRRVTRARKPIV